MSFVAALIGGAFALLGQYFAHGFTTRRERKAELRDSAAGYLANVESIGSVFRTAYANAHKPGSRLDTARLDAIQVPLMTTERRLRWVLETLKLPTRYLTMIKKAQRRLTAEWTTASESDWSQFNEELLDQITELELLVEAYMADGKKAASRFDKRITEMNKADVRLTRPAKS